MEDAPRPVSKTPFFIVGLVIAFAIGAYVGWEYKQAPSELTSSAAVPTTGRFYAESFTPFSFVYPKRLNAIWEGTNSSFYYSVAGIPTDAKGLVLSFKPTTLPSLKVSVDIDGATTTDFALMKYIDTKYPSSAYGKVEYRTSLTPYESTDHQFSGYFVNYEVDGMAGHSGEALVLKLNKGCNSPNPSDCSYMTYTIDNVSGMYTPSDFQKIADSITRVP